jgi:hypothetical protein
MKHIISQASLALMGTILAFSASAQINVGFNTSMSAPTPAQVKGYLQNNCWTFPDMDVNCGDWDPGIEGDGAMVSGASGQIPENTGIYSPVLDIPGHLAVSFSYKFNQDVEGSASLKLFLVDHNHQVFMSLDNISVSGSNSSDVYNYSKTLTNLPSGPYKLYIQYKAPGGARIAIDELQINVPFYYSGGCNQAPVAANDQISGNANRTASGQIKNNDYDLNSDYFSVYLLQNSVHGNVTLNTDGTFTFTPNPGFSGNVTTFTYQACDNGFGPACSNIATVTITFAGGMLPVRLADFTASVNDANDVTVRWTTTYEQASNRFEVERSFDGITFETAGTVKAAGTSFGTNNYAFTERLRVNQTSKKDVYYRLRLVDANEKAEVSKILVLRLFRTSSLAMISVTPNPVVNDINIQLQLKENAFVVMKVANNNGVEVSRKSIRGNQGLNVFSLDGTSKLKPGIYMLEVIINSNERMSIKLVKN